MVLIAAGTHVKVVTAFDKVWSLVPVCTGVDASIRSRGLWNDMPGAATPGVNNDAGLIWLVTDDAGNEYCTYSATVPNMPTNDFPTLRMRAAVNDGARFAVGVYGWNRSTDNRKFKCAGVRQGEGGLP